MEATLFVLNHTIRDHSAPYQDECPICLDNYTSERCLRIANIPDCSHRIGANCLDRMLRSRPHEEKRCPLCRAVWTPARPLPLPPREQSPSASRRMAGMFAGLDGIGADIANQQLGTRRGFAHNDIPQLEARQIHGEPPNVANTHPPRASMAEQQRNPIVIDSDSDDADYATHVQNYEAYRRDIADIRNRAAERNISRSTRKRRAAERTSNDRNDNGGSNAGANSSSNSENATAAPSLGRRNTSAREGSRTPGTGAFNRFMNNRRTLNPFRPTTTIVDQDEDGRAVEYSATRQFFESLDPKPQVEGRANPQTSLWGLESSRAFPSDPGASQTITPHAQLLGPNTPGTPIDVDMASDELVQVPVIQPLPTRALVRSQQLDHREENLDRRQQAMTLRQTTLARREAEIVVREKRAMELVRVAKRHREEAEELIKRHREEMDEVFKNNEK